MDRLNEAMQRAYNERMTNEAFLRSQERTGRVVVSVRHEAYQGLIIDGKTFETIHQPAS